MTLRHHLPAAVLALALFAIPCRAAAQCPAFADATAEVVAWNLGGLPAIPLGKAPVYANAIADLDAEVVVLVEVNPDAIVGEIVAELNNLGLCYQRALLPQAAQQNLAVLAKQGVSLTNPRLVAGSDAGNRHLRQALAVDLRLGNFDCLLVAIHLKAGRDRDDRAERSLQAAAIARFIDEALAGPEDDVVVIGDGNMVPVEDAANFQQLNPAGYLSVLSDALAGQISHLSADGGGSLLDCCAVSAAHTTEVLAGSLRIVPLPVMLGLTPREFRAQVSDHLPLEATFRITRDDD